MKYIGGDTFTPSTNPINTCKICRRLKWVGTKTKILVCIRCDVPPEAVGATILGGK